MRLKLFFILLFVTAFSARSQTLGGLADSVFNSLKYADFDSLKKFIPGYRDLKGVYDSMDIDRQAPDILITQKRVEYALRKSFKTFIKEADNLDIPLNKMEKEEIRHLIQTYEDKRYSVVEVDCRYKNRGATIYFTAIELNDAWYLGEEFRIEKRLVEEAIDYEKIDREAEKRREERARKREKLKEKAEKDSAQAEKLRKIETEKKAKEEAKQKKDEEKAKKKAEQEAEKKRKLEEKERKKLEKKKKKDNLKPPPAPIIPPDTNRVDSVAPEKQ